MRTSCTKFLVQEEFRGQNMVAQDHQENKGEEEWDVQESFAILEELALVFVLSNSHS